MAYEKGLILIPARYNSHRLPGKALADIAGKTMIRRTYERCKLSEIHAMVVTDDKRIVNECLEHSIPVDIVTVPKSFEEFDSVMSFDKPAASVVVWPLLEIEPVWVIAPEEVRSIAPPAVSEATSKAPVEFSKVIDPEPALAVSDVPDDAAELEEMLPVLAVRSSVATEPKSMG